MKSHAGIQKASERPRPVVIGTAGHIDHGKTALVLALTGRDTDRLPEEKARGITIDLGFAAFLLKGEGGQSFDVSLVDVPGHQAFIRNMLAGAGGIEAVMLVVAADEGPKAGTVEHLQICQLLGIARGVVVLTKQDAVSAERMEGVRDEVRRVLEGSFLEGAPMVAVSAFKREGLGELQAELARMVAAVPPRSDDRVARLPVDRVFSVRGFGTVVTGTLQDGTVRSGELMRVEPERRTVRVRGLQIHDESRAEAKAPNRVALNLAGIEVGELRRGDTLVPPETLEAVGVVDAAIEALAGAPKLRHGQRVKVHAFAAESMASVLLYREPAEAAVAGGVLARLRLARPMVLLPGDRFVLRLPSPEVTLGGGRVLDAHPVPRLRKVVVAERLRALLAASAAEKLRLRVSRRDQEGLSLPVLLRETGLATNALQRMLAPFVADGSVVQAADFLMEGGALLKAEARLVREVAHAASPLTRAELRSRPRLREATFGLALQRLLLSGRLFRVGDRISSQAPSGTERATPSGRAAEVERMYRQAGLASPLVSEATMRLGMAAGEMRAVLTALLREGKLVRLGSDALLVHRDSVEQLKQQLQKHKGQNIDVARFKALTGLTRKHAIPLLEHLDATRTTRNAGDVRVVL